MSSTHRESLVEVPREGMGPLTQFVPDTPWSTTTLQALQNRKAKVFVDVPQHPRNMVVCVRGGDEPGDHDQAYLYGLPSSNVLRSYVASVDRATEFIADAELAPMVLDVHPSAAPREAACFWFDRLELPACAQNTVPLRRLRLSDADAAVALVPPWAFRTFESPRDMILGGGCYGVELNGKLVSIAYVADQSIKYARIAAMTVPEHRRKGYAFAAVRKLMEHCVDDGRLVCCLAARRNPAPMYFGLKLGFTGKALLRTYKVVPNADQPASAGSPAESTSSAVQAEA